MASIYTLQQSCNWAQAFLGYLPLNVGASNEPAITSANTILQTILAPPFKWRWNRNSVDFALSANTQDYTQSIADFGFIESCTVQATTGTDQAVYEIDIKDELSGSTLSARPNAVSVQKDDDAGNITFRFVAVPDQAYTCNVTYQKRAPQVSALSSTWTPIPDYLSYVYNWGFLALMSEYADNEAVARLRQLFVASLISLAQGITEEERNLFINSWLSNQIQVNTANQNVQLAARARGI